MKIPRWLNSNNIIYNKTFAFSLWFGLSSLAILQSWVHSKGINNYHIFRHVFVHARAGQNLYLLYPKQYGDVNLYGPLFSLLIAPFALMPVYIGAACWVIFNAAFLCYAIWQLPVHKNIRTAIILLCSNEMMNNAAWFQVNPFIAGCIILGFCYIHQQKDSWALFFILLATFIKIYGIVGFAFFFFSKEKMRFIFWAISWSLLFFFLPLCISSWKFLFQSYQDWYVAIAEKAAKNIHVQNDNLAQDISVMGMMRRIFHWYQLKDAWVLAPAGIIFLSQYIYRNYFMDLRFQLYVLCAVLLSVVIFSSGSESVTYIIAAPALCLWCFLQPSSKTATVYFIIAFAFTTFSYSDILTPWFRAHVARPYALKALPSFITWCIIIIQVHRRQFLQVDLQTLQKQHATTTNHTPQL